jgi:hypothetical protein
MLRVRFIVMLLCAASGAAAAQAPKAIDPGMSQTQVIDRLGQPSTSRTTGTFTYLFYQNGCVRECGMDDVVILENDAVVDAVFRSPERHYTGKSSSPRAIPADVAVRGRPAPRDVTVQQAGEPRPSSESQPAEPTSDTAKTTPKEPDAKPAARPSPKPKADSSRPDSTTGSLRIKVKPEHHSPGASASRDSAQAGGKPPAGG